MLLDTNNREIFISRNVIFYEKVFPYKAFTEISNFDKKLDQNSFDFLIEPLHHTINKDDITYCCNETDNNAEIKILMIVEIVQIIQKNRRIKKMTNLITILDDRQELKKFLLS